MKRAYKKHSFNIFGNTEMTTIKIEINSCKDCPHFEQKRYYTDDSFELAYDWHCKKEDGRKIQGYVEWHEEKHIKIPEWCPAL
jgi:hypothetical protein